MRETRTDIEITCPKCGCKYTLSMYVCPQCGNMIPPELVQGNKGNGKSKVVILTVIAVLCLIAIVLIFAFKDFFLQEDMKTTGMSHTQAVIHSDTQEEKNE